MLRLNPIVAPTWVEIVPGVEFLIEPVSALTIAMAGDAARAMLPDQDKGAVSQDVWLIALTMAVAPLVVTDWRGVGDLDGNALPFKADLVPVIMQEWPVAHGFRNKVLLKAAALVSEKKGYAPLQNGTSAGALNTAADAKAPATSALPN